MKPNRREFLTMAGAVGFACGPVFSAAEAPTRRDGKPVKSRIRVAQIKVYPQKGQMAANHRKLMGVLRDMERVGATGPQTHNSAFGSPMHASPVLDVVVTPEGFLDGYVSTEPSVTKADMVNYAIDPGTSEYSLEASSWAKRNETWLIYARSAAARRGLHTQGEGSGIQHSPDL